MRLVSVALATATFTLALTLGACTSEDGNDFEDVPDEPALDQGEQQLLPTGLEAEHLDDLTAALASEVPENDAARFDDDTVIGIVDDVVVDDEETSVAPGTIAYQPLLKYGLHPRASDALRACGVASWRLTQTIGNAAASAGTHAKDGSVNGNPYSAATDISV